MPRPPRAPAPRLALAAVALALGCETPATGVLVVVGTDIDPALPLTVTAHVARGLDGGEGRLAGPWARTPAGGSLDGGVALPLSFGIVPGENPVEEPVSVMVEADVGGVTLRRRAIFAFVPRQTGVLRIFLTQRCAEPAVGCLEPVRCSVQQLCEEQGLTCGNDGTCVALRAPLSDDRDASFGDVSPTEACGGYGQRCCTFGASCAGANTCVAGTCRRCADPEQRCCDGADLRPNGSTCAPSSDPCRAAGTCTDGVCGAITNAADGLPCGAATGVCQLTPTCMGGVCTPRDTPDNTPCGDPANACQRAPVCMGGVCTPRDTPDNTPCGDPANACQRAPVCMGGACTPRPAVDGTPCGAAPDACHRAPVCAGGACLAPAAVADGTQCGAAADGCHLTSVCMAGACRARNAPNGTACGGANGPCLRGRVCGNGVCLAAVPEANGTVCEGARNPCEEPARCSGGVCGGHRRLPDDSPWGGGGFNRCCNGNAIVVNSAAHCGGCNITCRSGSCRSALGRYYCACSSNQQCAPGICRTQSPNANLCACENTADCPAGMRCVDVSFNPNYCTF